MVFSSPEFLIFFAACMVIHWGVLAPFREGTRERLQHLFLLAASYYFYMSWNAYLVILIVFTTAVDYVAGLALAGTHSVRARKAILAVSLGTNIGVLALFKYANFFLDSVNTAAQVFGAHPGLALHILLPVGISFYTFQSMSYTIDVYRNDLKAERSFVRFALYIAFFPQLVAGPIVRAGYLLDQFDVPKRLRDVQVLRGVNYLLLGLIKKLLISDWISAVPDQVFANPSAYDGMGTWIALFAYCIQIYCDFSGYSDMAVGSACLLGYDLPRNFNMPYLTASIADYWRQWHISLSTWLRDYVYVPLGGNRGSHLFQYRNMFLTMLLGGLWHGAHWTFVVWGALHGVALVAHRIFSRRFPVATDPATLRARCRWVAGWVCTCLFVAGAFIFFRAQDFGTIRQMLLKISFLDRTGNHAFSPSLAVLMGVVVLGHMAGLRYFSWIDRPEITGARWAVYVGAVGIVLAFLFLFAPSGTQPFIYFQF